MEVIKTADGSTTLYIKELDETYHSRHGAIQEAQHVFIENGLKKCTKNHIRVFEMGFGTGLNALLTKIHSEDRMVSYTGIEKHPIQEEVVKQVNYWKELEIKENDFQLFHSCDWGTYQDLSEKFKLRKIEGDLSTFETEEKFDLIFYDAFGPRAQGAMWEKEILRDIVSLMDEDAIFVTYCAKGQVRRDLQDLGLEMERLPGPPGKREMLFGRKIKR